MWFSSRRESAASRSLRDVLWSLGSTCNCRLGAAPPNLSRKPSHTLRPPSHYPPWPLRRYLCTSALAPAYIGLELGVGDSLLVKAIAEATVRMSGRGRRGGARKLFHPRCCAHIHLHQPPPPPSTPQGRAPKDIKAAADAAGDLGLVAESSRAHQKTIFGAASATAGACKSAMLCMSEEADAEARREARQHVRNNAPQRRSRSPLVPPAALTRSMGRRQGRADRARRLQRVPRHRRGGRLQVAGQKGPCVEVGTGRCALK